MKKTIDRALCNLELAIQVTGFEPPLLPRVLLQSYGTSQLLRLHELVALQASVQPLTQRQVTNSDQRTLRSLQLADGAQSLFQRGLQLEENLPLSKPKAKLLAHAFHSFNYRRLITRFCKVLCVPVIGYLFLIASPEKIAQGLYQGLVHGWSSECSDWFRCNR